MPSSETDFTGSLPSGHLDAWLWNEIKRKTNNLSKVKRRIQKLANKKIKSGYFADQGSHPNSDLSYADLAYLHASGARGLPERDIRFDAIDELKSFNFGYI